MYEGAGWCTHDEDLGHAVESDTWCGRWPKSSYAPAYRQHLLDLEMPGGVSSHKCKVMPGKKRWPRMGAYANEDGQDARSCCCNSGLAQTYPYSPSHTNLGVCKDLTFKGTNIEWHDKNGWSCQAYYFGNLCNERGKRGDGWNKRWKAFKKHRYSIHYRGKFQMDAKKACCACGGGDPNTVYDYPAEDITKRIYNFWRKAGTDGTEKHYHRIHKYTNIALQEGGRGRQYTSTMTGLLHDLLSSTHPNFSKEQWAEVDAAFRAFAGDLPKYRWLILD